MQPQRVSSLATSLRQPADLLRSVEASLPEESLRLAASLALKACDGLFAAGGADNPMLDAYRAMRLYSRAQEALFAAENLPEVSRFLLPPASRNDKSVLARLAAPPSALSGVFHSNNEIRQRGGFSVYVPPFYDSRRTWPVVVALHGGSGHGRLFLTNWVPFARARGLIVIAPTAIGDTWSLMHPEVDSRNLASILAELSDRWRFDPDRCLLTGMSDGGTFTLLSGVDVASPFTHLAPVAAAFHPMVLAMSDPARLVGLPIYMVHGALDWMFPVNVARTAHRALQAAGAAIVYREVADLSHTYPVDEQNAILDWFLNRPAATIES
jgi:phospholipase/carboxylesterase